MTTSRSQDTRNAILDACDRIMARYGFLKMSMDDQLLVFAKSFLPKIAMARSEWYQCASMEP
ncbi:hypothetical protein EON82_00230 [bacterium]|nr:MAG: hypothetical protein EON82_00230 [bacterium]